MNFLFIILLYIQLSDFQKFAGLILQFDDHSSNYQPEIYQTFLFEEV